MGVRNEQKQATREKVLEAARDLFNETGYEETTIRPIAERAGVSVGSVFTTFASKAEVLSHVMDKRLGELYAEFDRVVPFLRGSTADRLCSIFAIHYEFETRRVKLFLAHIAASYSPSPDPGVTPYGRNERLTQMLFDTYLSNFPQAIFEGWSLDALQARARDQIRILLAGARRG